MSIWELAVVQWVVGICVNVEIGFEQSAEAARTLAPQERV